MLILIATVPLILGGVLAARAVRALRDGRAFTRSAVRASGTVTRLRTQWSRDRFGGPPRHLFFPTVRYTTHEGGEFEAEPLVGTSVSPPREDEPVIVLYDPADPARMQLERNRGTTTFLGVLALLGSVMFLSIGTMATLVAIFIQRLPGF